MNSKKRYYSTFEDDFFQVDKSFSLPEDYQYIKTGLFSRILSALTYFAAFLFSVIYCPIFLHVKIVGAKKLRQQKGGFFLYGNHTQPIGDVFDPALACLPKRIYTVVSPSNMYLPVIGKLLRPLGALPIPSSISGMKKFNRAIEQRIAEGHPIAIYPEAHLWEYYTDIRPFNEGAFNYPVRLGTPSYCFTTTYQKRKWGKKPKITLYIDGPFFPEGGSRRAMAKDLCEKIHSQMKLRAALSDCEYIKYIKKDDLV